MYLENLCLEHVHCLWYKGKLIRHFPEIVFLLEPSCALNLDIYYFYIHLSRLRVYNTSLELPNGCSLSVNRRMTCNTMAKKKRTKGKATNLQNITPKTIDRIGIIRPLLPHQIYFTETLNKHHELGEKIWSQYISVSELRLQVDCCFGEE